MRYFGLIRSFGRAGLVLSALVAGPVLANDAQTKVAELKTFRDWMVGCDNIRSCTAIGLPPGREASGYVVVERDGAGGASTQVSLVVRTEDAIKSPIELSILIDGEPVLGMPQASYPAGVDKNDINTARLELPAEDAANLVRQIQDRKELNLKVTGPGRAPAESTISLTGAPAAFLYMDVDQFRAGTVTALAGSGWAAASTVPHVPHVPVLKPVLMRDVKDLPATLPAGVAPNLDDCTDHPPKPDLIRLSPQLELWGMCYVSAAYNLLRRYWIVDRGQVKEASFIVPGRKPRADGPAVLVNAELAQSGRVLESFALGRGLGDCGTHTMWVWTGTEFQLAFLAEMTDCRGVPVADWPVMHTSQWK
ncbi:DUF1176 domain-containing protein [Aquabacter sp. CN5-332]|uniref:DUF1176 domain-containing protein n=1 Tax=Aquabacter sp. CN5-332 TaxID=3156608 RepID=UPI0032B3D09A